MGTAARSRHWSRIKISQNDAFHFIRCHCAEKFININVYSMFGEIFVPMQEGSGKETAKFKAGKHVLLSPCAAERECAGIAECFLVRKKTRKGNCIIFS